MTLIRLQLDFKHQEDSKKNNKFETNYLFNIFSIKKFRLSILINKIKYVNEINL